VSVGFCQPYESDRPSARVLIVDGDRGATVALARQLRDLGCSVSYTFDARLALLFARKARPQVVLVDLATPHVNGSHLADALRKEYAFGNCALIGLSGCVDRASGAADPRLGFAAFLAKPVAVPELQAAIKPFVAVVQDRLFDEPTPVSDATVPIPAFTTRA